MAFAPVFDVVVVCMPSVEHLTRTPAFYIGARVKPVGHLGKLGVGVVRHFAKFNYDVDLVVRQAAATVTPIGFDCLKDEGVLKGVSILLGVAGGDDLASPLGEFATVCLLAESLLHIS